MKLKPAIFILLFSLSLFSMNNSKMEYQDTGAQIMNCLKGIPLDSDLDRYAHEISLCLFKHPESQSGAKNLILSTHYHKDPNKNPACRIMGYSRDTFYRYKHAKESGGVEALYTVANMIAMIISYTLV